MRVGVTGSSGFIGWHLRALARRAGEIEVVPLTRDDFADHAQLGVKLSTCDAIVHLAGGRVSDLDEESYRENLTITEQLIAGLVASKTSVPVFYASSASIRKDTGYGRAKREGGELLAAWGQTASVPVGAIVFPNIFGEFAQPHHHTVVATFCQEIADGKTSVINEAGSVELVHVQSAAKAIYDFLQTPWNGQRDMVGVKLSIRELYNLLVSMYATYVSGVYPELSEPLHKELFNTLYSYTFEVLVPRPLIPKTDARGTLLETVRSLSPGQSFMSSTVPGAIRGEHYHVRKIERFAVISGEATIRLRKIMDDQILEFRVSGDSPKYIDMPTFYTHHIENTGAESLVTAFWTDELYDEMDPDTYREPVQKLI